MNYQEILQDLKLRILPFLEEENIELVEMNLFRSKGGLVLKLLVDKKDSRINLEECARLNERISNLLDNLDIIKERYFIEVSSPGIDRPIKTKNDFLRVKGRKITVFLCETQNGRKEFSGVLRDVDDNFVFLEVNREIVKIAFKNITLAKQTINKVASRE